MNLSDVRAQPTASRARRGEGDRTRDSILTAAGELLEELRSEEAVSIRSVADRVGVTAPTIYRYFTDKQHLIFEVCSMHFDQFEDEVINPAMEAHEDPLEALAAIAEAYVEFGLNNPEHYRVMFMSHHDHTPEQWEEVALLDRGSFASMLGLVHRCVERGQLRGDLGDTLEESSIAAALALWAGIHGLTALAVARPGMPAPPIGQRVATMIKVLFEGVVPR